MEEGKAICDCLLGSVLLITAPITLPVAGLGYLVFLAHGWWIEKKTIKVCNVLSKILGHPIPEWCCDGIFFGWTTDHVTTLMVLHSAKSNTIVSFIQSNWLPGKSYFIVQIDASESIPNLVNIACTIHDVSDDRHDIVRIFNYSTKPSIMESLEEL